MDVAIKKDCFSPSEEGLSIKIKKNTQNSKLKYMVFLYIMIVKSQTNQKKKIETIKKDLMINLLTTQPL